MSKPLATIYDVANRAGVSISTVSRVLNNPGKVQEQTRKAVLTAMDELSFIPKAEAIARARKHLYRIGVITPFLTEASFVQRIRGISDYLNPSQFELIIYTVKTNEQLSEYLDMLSVGGRLDGLIVLSILLPDDQRLRLKRSGIPVVFVEVAYDEFSAVAIDNVRGGQVAAEYLLSRGYTQFGFLGEYSSMSFALAATEQRLEGFRQTLKRAGISLEERFVRTSEMSKDQGDRWISDLLLNPERPQVLFASSDILGAKIMKIASKHGLKVPEDIGILAFDDLDMAEFLHLSTVSQSLDASGRLAAELLEKKISRKDEPRRKILLDLSVVDRGSC
jgi:LacI family transcriptional regulator